MNEKTQEVSDRSKQESKKKLNDKIENHSTKNNKLQKIRERKIFKESRCFFQQVFIAQIQ